MAPAFAAASFSVLLDPVRPHRTGDELRVFYDVCGLEPATPYKLQVVVTKQEGGLRSLFGGSTRSLSFTYEGKSKGPGSRDHTWGRSRPARTDSP